MPRVVSGERGTRCLSSYRHMSIRHRNVHKVACRRTREVLAQHIRLACSKFIVVCLVLFQEAL